METWILPALLGLGLAASCGLKTFLPLLMLSAASRFGLFGFDLGPAFDWLDSTPALIALTIAAAIEFVGDKIPVVDHALSAIGTVSRPIAGALAAGAAFSQADPMVAAIAGLIIGAPTALAFHTAQSGTRIASTATTAGIANPFVSVAEDVLAVVTVLVAFLAPLLIPLILVLVLYAVWRLVKAVRRGLLGATVSTPRNNPATGG
jgi:hypothetical protein